MHRFHLAKVRRAVTGTSLLLVLLSIPGLLHATPVLDPICGAPNSLERVLALRQQAAFASRRAIALQALSPTAPPILSIDRANGFNLPRFLVEGPTGQLLDLEASADLKSGRWEPWLTVTLGNQPVSWIDTGSRLSSARFFRLRTGNLERLGDPASNFRLLDERGVARDLYYHTHLQGIAVLAAGDDLRSVSPSLPILNELAVVYTNRLQIWILLSDPAMTRSNLVTQTKELGIGFPVLADTSGLAARSVGLTRAGEVALIEPPAFTVAYRGEIAGIGQISAAQSFMGEALAALSTSRTATFARTPGPGPLLSHATEPTPAYTTEVAPILTQYCVSCHRPNGVAPFAMTNHNVVKTWSWSMKHALLSRKMPPWHADPEYGHFSNDLSIPDSLKAALIRWIDAGSPRGEGPDPLEQLPAQKPFDAWPEDLGEPDALVTIPLQSIKATGIEPYRYIFVQTPNPTNVSVRAAIIRPSNYTAVHHILVWLGRIGNRSSTTNSSSYESHIAEYVPGIKPFRIPADAGVSLSRSNWLTFNLHYNTYGEATNDQPVLALWYHKTKPKRTWFSAAVSNGDIKIPPGAPDSQWTASWTIPSSPSITIHRLNPHMHLRGKRMKYEVIYPNRKREVLLSVPDYDFNWQVGYDLAEPITIPGGSTIFVTGAFDNSPQNLSNPDPTATVRWGDQSQEEMLAGFFDYTQ